MYIYIQYRLSTDSVDKQRIVIRRNTDEAELFNQKPTLLQHYDEDEDDYWLTLLCHGGRIFDLVHVMADKEGCKQSVALDAYRWYPRSLFKTLLLVSAILRSWCGTRYLSLFSPARIAICSRNSTVLFASRGLFG